MNIDKMTYNVQAALEFAQNDAVEEKLQTIEVENLMKHFVIQSDSMLNTIFERSNLDIKAYESILNEALTKMPRVEGNVQYGQYLSNGINQLLNAAEKR